MQISLPLPARSATHMKAKTYQVFGDGANRLLVTDLRHIGAHVARVVADARTLGHAVMIWEDEPTQLETHEIGERYSGEGESIKAQRQYVRMRLFGCEGPGLTCACGSGESRRGPSMGC